MLRKGQIKKTVIEGKIEGHKARCRQRIKHVNSVNICLERSGNDIMLLMTAQDKIT